MNSLRDLRNPKELSGFPKNPSRVKDLTKISEIWSSASKNFQILTTWYAIGLCPSIQKWDSRSMCRHWANITAEQASSKQSFQAFWKLFSGLLQLVDNVPSFGAKNDMDDHYFVSAFARPIFHLVILILLGSIWRVSRKGFLSSLRPITLTYICIQVV